MEYERAYVRQFFAAMTPDSRPCRIGLCPIMVAYPAVRRMADATRADPELVNALDREYKRTHGGLPWGQFRAGEIVLVIDSLR